MNKDYWKKYWTESGIIDKQDAHDQVGRTKYGKRIDDETWNETVQFLTKKLKLDSTHNLLDLCAGNGVMAAEMIGYVNSIVAVDISEKLLESFIIDHDQIHKVHSDILGYDFPEGYFDRILFYFSAQHFSKIDMTKVVSKAYRSLRKDGILYIGDIPDVTQQWNFYSTKKNRSFLFDSWLRGEPHIGFWYDRYLFKYLSEYLGFSSCNIISQPEFMINSSYRFDVLLKK